MVVLSRVSLPLLRRGVGEGPLWVDLGGVVVVCGGLAHVGRGGGLAVARAFLVGPCLRFVSPWSGVSCGRRLCHPTGRAAVLGLCRGGRDGGPCVSLS